MTVIHIPVNNIGRAICQHLGLKNLLGTICQHLRHKNVCRKARLEGTKIHIVRAKSGFFAQMVGKSTAGACSAEALCPNLPSSSGAGFTCFNLSLSSRPVSMLAHSAALSGCDKSPPKSSQDMHMPMAEHRLRGRARACTLQLML